MVTGLSLPLWPLSAIPFYFGSLIFVHLLDYPAGPGLLAAKFGCFSFQREAYKNPLYSFFQHAPSCGV